MLLLSYGRTYHITDTAEKEVDSIVRMLDRPCIRLDQNDIYKNKRYPPATDGSGASPSVWTVVLENLSQLLDKHQPDILGSIQ
jgi:hypothetical protein